LASYSTPAFNIVDNNLNVLEINKHSLQKNNNAIFCIKEARTLSDLLEVDLRSLYTNGVPVEKTEAKVRVLFETRKSQLEAIERVKSYWRSSLGMSEAIETALENDWEKKFADKTGTGITDEENRLESLMVKAKVQPEIDEITRELNTDPVVSLDFDYAAVMLNLALATEDAARADKKSSIIAEIQRLRREKTDQEEEKQRKEEEKQRKEEERKQKIQSTQDLITSAQTVLNNSAATKEEVEKAIKELKALVSAAADSVEKSVWEEKKTEHEKLLTDLETKLTKLNAPPAPKKKSNPMKVLLLRMKRKRLKIWPKMKLYQSRFQINH